MIGTSPGVPLPPPAELDFELKCYLESGASGFQFLRHPLLTTMYCEAFNAEYNEQLRQRRAAAQELKANEQWGALIFFHERPYRLSAYSVYAKRLPKRAQADLLTEVWIDSEGPHVNRAHWLRLFRRLAPHSTIMAKSRGHLPTTPFTVFRGSQIKEGSQRRQYGMSWTLEEGKARWFATRFNASGYLYSATINPSDCFAYFIDRGEQEVVLDPCGLLDVRREPVRRAG